MKRKSCRMRFRNRFVLLITPIALALTGCFQQAGTALQEPIVSNQQVVVPATSIPLPTQADGGTGDTNNTGNPGILNTPTLGTLPDTISTDAIDTGNTDTTNPPVALTIISATLPPIATETPLVAPTDANGQMTEVGGTPGESQFITPSGPLGPITQVPIVVGTSAGDTGQSAATPSGLITPTAFSPVDTAGNCTHTIAAGDTLYRIALKYEVTVADLRNANPQLVGDIIQPGDVLKVPGCKPTSGGNTGSTTVQATSTTAPAATGLPSGSQTYVVKRGDTLYTIGLKFGVTADAIQKANNIANPNRINLGQELVIPAKSG
ncbi:MAG: LysM peptidoglycan-binding domain-containing protein [Anaerolineae bacterium]|nr:LysM peptidoglycan-binding domain-containing protein [Anaerolineae bacterium]